MSAPVNINIRIRRTDGKPMGFAEARRALLYTRNNGGEPPTGYLVSGCSWEDPSKSSKGWVEKGNPGKNAGALSAPLYIGNIVRLGAVKK
jgi:hypothetical protein